MECSENLKWSTINLEWSMVNLEWSLVNLEWSRVNSEWRMEIYSGELGKSAEFGKFKVEYNKFRVE